MPRIEHVQMLHPDDRPRFAAGGIAASVQPVHLGSDAAQARKLWGDRAEAEAYTWRSIAETGAVMPFGTDAPVEPSTRGPGSPSPSAARTRAGRGHAGLSRPEQALDPRPGAARRTASTRRSRRARRDRGRLTVGQRADVVVIPAAALEEPVDARRRAVRRPARPWCCVDGEVVFEV